MNKIIKKSVLFMLGTLVAVSVQADPVELLKNGEFEDPTITAHGGNWEIFGEGEVPGWSCAQTFGSVTGCELWKQGFNSSPTNGTDGDPTGQHHEITGAGTMMMSSQAVLVGSDATGVLRFDHWWRHNDSNGALFWSVLVDNTQVLSGQVNPVFGAWTAFESAKFDLPESKIVEVRFGDGTQTGGVHIDQVSLMAYCKGECVVQAVPEPGSLALLGLGLAGIGFARRKKA